MAEKQKEKNPLLKDEQATEIVATFFRAAEVVAAVESLGEPIEFETERFKELGGRVGVLLQDLKTRSDALATKVCETRRDAFGAEAEAVKLAREERKKVVLGEAEASVVAGRIVEAGSLRPVGDLQVIARTARGEIVAEQAADAAGAFTVEMKKQHLEELRLEVLDPSGAPVAVSTVKLSTKTPTANFVTITVPAVVTNWHEKDPDDIEPDRDEHLVEITPRDRSKLRRRSSG